jgi:hypothetical protein
MPRTPRRNDPPEHEKPQRPARKTSQGGYGHRSNTTGSTTPQGSGRNKPKQRPG